MHTHKIKTHTKREDKKKNIHKGILKANKNGFLFLFYFIGRTIFDTVWFY